jgi:GcpE protein
MVARCGSGSMPAHSSATCWSAMASPARKPWSRARSTMPRSSKTTTSSSSRSRARPTTCFSRSPLISSSPRPATTRCIWASPSRRFAQWYHQVIDRARHALVVRHRRHDPHFALRRPGRGGQGRFRNPEIAELRRRGVTVVSCPSCARQQFEMIKTVERLEGRLAHITTPMTVSVIGCVVNRPGEARETASASRAAATAPIRSTSTD